MLSEAFEQLGGLAQALHHERQYHRVREAVFNEEGSTRMRNLELTYQAEQKDREAELERVRNDALETKNEELARLVEQLQATQSQLIQSEKMSSLGNLVAALAHEINTPLGAIRSSSDLLERCVDRILAAVNQSSTLEQLRSSRSFQSSVDALREERLVSAAGIERISRIVNSLRSFSQLDQAAYSLLDIPRALEDILTLVESDLRTKQIEVQRSFAEVPKLYAYVSEIHQVFMNLVQNSAETMNGGGRLIISTSSDDRNVQVCFQDTAPQVPPEGRLRLFDPSISTQGERASGSMRMFTCLHIIRKHGGEIYVDAGASEGMRYTVQIPCRLANFPSPPDSLQTIQ